MHIYNDNLVIKKCLVLSTVDSKIVCNFLIISTKMFFNYNFMYQTRYIV